MNEQEQSVATVESEKPEKESENRPKIKRGAIGRFVCPICQDKWHPKKYHSVLEFVEAHNNEHGSLTLQPRLQLRDFVVKEFSSS